MATIQVIDPPRDFYFARGTSVLDLPSAEKQVRQSFIQQREISRLQGDEDFVRQVAEMHLNPNELEFDFFDTGIVIIDAKNPQNRFNLKMNPKFWDINEKILRIAEFGIPGPSGHTDEDRVVSGSGTHGRPDLLPPLKPDEEAAFAIFPRDALKARESSLEDRTVRGSSGLGSGWDEHEEDLRPDISMEDRVVRGSSSPMGTGWDEHEVDHRPDISMDHIAPTTSFPRQGPDRVVHGSRSQPQTYPMTAPTSGLSLQSQLDRFEEQLRRQKEETDRFERLLGSRV